MRKKVLSALLALVMVLSLVPAAALALEVWDGEDDVGVVESDVILAATGDEAGGELAAGDTAAAPLKGACIPITEKVTSVIESTVEGIPCTTVSVRPYNPVSWSDANTNIGRTAGWWIGFKMVAPSNVKLSDQEEGAVVFRNSTNPEDRAWVSPTVDGQTQEGRYFMEGWSGVKPAHIEKDQFTFVMSWYYNWDGKKDTGITIPASKFSAANATAMEGVDEMFTLSFNLKDPGVQLLGEDNKTIVWNYAPAVTAAPDEEGKVKIDTTAVDSMVEAAAKSSEKVATFEAKTPTSGGAGANKPASVEIPAASVKTAVGSNVAVAVKSGDTTVTLGQEALAKVTTAAATASAMTPSSGPWSRGSPAAPPPPPSAPTPPAPGARS